LSLDEYHPRRPGNVAMAVKSTQGVSHISNPVKRIRWATQRVTGPNEQSKRHGILDRLHKRTGSSEKKQEFGDAPHAGSQQQDAADLEEGGEQEPSQRRIFFNIPLPDDAKDEEGRPLTRFGRNKIRTAKYTPLSFVPKNLYYQFHQVANIYFLFLVILGVRTSSFVRDLALLTSPSRHRSSKYSEIRILRLVRCRS